MKRKKNTKNTEENTNEKCIWNCPAGSTNNACSNRGVTTGNNCLPLPFALWLRDSTYVYLCIQVWGQLVYGSPDLWFESGTHQYFSLNTSLTIGQPTSAGDLNEFYRKYTIGNWVEKDENLIRSEYMSETIEPIGLQPNFYKDVIGGSKAYPNWNLWRGVDFSNTSQKGVLKTNDIQEPSKLYNGVKSLLKFPEPCIDHSDKTDVKYFVTLYLSQYQYDKYSSTSHLDARTTLLTNYLNFFLGFENHPFEMPDGTHPCVGAYPSASPPRDKSGTPNCHWNLEISLPSASPSSISSHCPGLL